MGALLALWAKFGNRNKETSGYHPLLCHQIDTAAVAELLCDYMLCRRESATVFDCAGLRREELKRWICFYAALHDLGKASPVFQIRDRHVNERLPDYLRAWDGGVAAPPHGLVTAWALREILANDFRHPGKLATDLSFVAGGHHGLFPAAADLARPRDRASGGASWREARCRIAQTLGSLLGVSGDPPAALTHAGAMVLAGLISVADWIASNEHYFPYAASNRGSVPELDLCEYQLQSRDQAEAAMSGLGWQRAGARPVARCFQELFRGYCPRPLQRAAGETGPKIHHPALVVLEAPMGEGKTEAALLLGEHLSSQGDLRGFYFALPTQATSNQMFGRLSAFLEETSPDPRVQLQLLHGHAALSAEFQELRKRSLQPFESSGVCGDAGDAEVIASEWFTFRKRGLLAPYGVGTIDQILLAVLQTRHVFVRCFGLSGKVVIIDEVHAYDTYMSALLERLLTWLAALGTSVVLLSATLPASRRAALAESYSQGLGAWTPRKLPAAAYPRVTWVTGSGDGGARSFQPSDAVRKKLALQAVERTGEWQAGLANRLRESLREGGCAAIICNTVGRAQELYGALKGSFPGTGSDGLPEVDLLHSRFVFGERERREKRSLHRFGPPPCSARPHRAVLVATQIVEQSLDLDFDLLVTDLAPVDLVLQRAGRLHRHARTRPGPLAEPQVWLFMPPADGEGIPQFETADQQVYDAHVLFRSWLALRDREAVELPEEIEALVEMVYDERNCPPDLGVARRRYWEATRTELKRAQEHERDEARVRWLKPPGADCSLDELTQSKLEEGSPEFHQAHQALTRLTDVSVAVVFLHEGGRLPSLEPDGRGPVDPALAPDLALSKELLLRSVTLADRRIVFDLLRQETPAGWAKSPLLRNHRLLCLNGEGEVRVGLHRVRLDAELGVVVSKET
ncbi:MAG: CRISPR-associated helicase Cas3' [Bryobacterales bacterium]|nr:CRISPR-associated helicase Cas3' [Bryobacterales bacterium]